MSVPHVAVLMATFNGQEFLDQQFASIVNQTHHNLSLWISDDGSTDRTPALLTAFQATQRRFATHILEGPRTGFVGNFLSLACNREIEADFFAFCDQDDVWHDDKLEAALRQLAGAPAGCPAVYVSRTRIVGDDGAARGFSPLFAHQPGIRNALVQSIGGGNTMVFNAAARDLLVRAGDDLKVPSHDWWTYLAVAACGGIVFYDPQPHVDYRQHDDNIIGENCSLAARIFRINLLLEGRFSTWLSANLEALRRLEPAIDPANRALIAEFEKVRRAPSVWRRLVGLRELGLYRQTKFGTASLYVAAVLKKW